MRFLYNDIQECFLHQTDSRMRCMTYKLAFYKALYESVIRDNTIEIHAILKKRDISSKSQFMSTRHANV